MNFTLFYLDGSINCKMRFKYLVGQPFPQNNCQYQLSQTWHYYNRAYLHTNLVLQRCWATSWVSLSFPDSEDSVSSVRKGDGNQYDIYVINFKDLTTKVKVSFSIWCEKWWTSSWPPVNSRCFSWPSTYIHIIYLKPFSYKHIYTYIHIYWLVPSGLFRVKWLKHNG